MLSNYELDLAIVEGNINDPRISAQLLDTDYIVCVVSNNNPLAKKNTVTLADIKKEKMILRLPNSGTRNLFMSHLESLGMSIDDFNVVLEVDNIATHQGPHPQGHGNLYSRAQCLSRRAEKRKNHRPADRKPQHDTRNQYPVSQGFRT